MIDNLTVIIITYQEECNIRDCILSLQGVTKNIFVVDSHSTDATQSILKDMDIVFKEHEFITYAEKRKWAQQNNPFKTEWVFHIDADERFSPELSTWLLNDFPKQKDVVDGFIFSRKTVFLNRWIKHGDQYPNFHLRLFKENLGFVEDKAYDNHFVLSSGVVRTIPRADIINNVADNLDDFILSHVRWATLEANDVALGAEKKLGDVIPNLFGNPIERKRWVKQNIFERAPLFVRSFGYFIYRYLIRLGFLDGKQGLIFFVLQTFWFRFLIDAKVFEIRTARRGEMIDRR